MRVLEVMTEGVRTVPPSLAAADAWQLMRTEGIHHLVVTSGRRIVGILSDRDAGGRAGASVRAGKSVADLMTRGVTTIQTEETVGRAANVMHGRTIGCLPVLAGKKLVGIVTTADLLEVIGAGGDRRPKVERRVLSHRVPHTKQHRRTGRAARAW
jgi:acetoin utilization protein AcuB